jgi:hypothetical protein
MWLPGKGFLLGVELDHGKIFRGDFSGWKISPQSEGDRQARAASSCSKA